MGKILPFKLKNRFLGIKGNKSIKTVSMFVIEISPLPLIMNGINGTNRSVSFSEITRPR